MAHLKCEWNALMSVTSQYKYVIPGAYRDLRTQQNPRFAHSKKFQIIIFYKILAPRGKPKSSLSRVRKFRNAIPGMCRSFLFQKTLNKTAKIPFQINA